MSETKDSAWITSNPWALPSAASTVQGGHMYTRHIACHMGYMQQPNNLPIDGMSHPHKHHLRVRVSPFQHKILVNEMLLNDKLGPDMPFASCFLVPLFLCEDN